MEVNFTEVNGCKIWGSKSLQSNPVKFDRCGSRRLLVFLNKNPDSEHAKEIYKELTKRQLTQYLPSGYTPNGH